MVSVCFVILNKKDHLLSYHIAHQCRYSAFNYISKKYRWGYGRISKYYLKHFQLYMQQSPTKEYLVISRSGVVPWYLQFIFILFLFSYVFFVPNKTMVTNSLASHHIMENFLNILYHSQGKSGTWIAIKKRQLLFMIVMSKSIQVYHI